MNVLFLYTELADYFLKCCEALSGSASVSIIRWPVNKEAPFKFRYSDAIRVYDKNDYSQEELKQLVASLNPDMIVCSGWIDKNYLALVKPYYKKIPTVLTCDTHWKGSLKQYAAVALSRFFLLDRFSHAWVPGSPQTTYAKKLGFRSENIYQGFYSCDLQKFNAVYEAQLQEKQAGFPKKFLYVGRYYEFKGHLKIADGVKIAGQSGIGSNIEKEGEIVQGSPAFGIGEYKRSYVLFRNLPKLNEKLSELSKKINNL